MTAATLNLTLDTSAFEKASAELQRQIPYAMSVALNNVAFRVRAEQHSAMGRVFDRPTRLTLNSVLVDKATKRKGNAQIFIRDEAAKGTPPEKYLGPEVFGKARNETRFERALRYAGLLPAGMYVVPGEGARLNKHGNITAGTYTKILSQVKASSDPMQNATNSARSSAKRGGTSGYFVARIEGTLGVWQRVGYARRRSVRPILIFVRNKPNYRKRFPFYRIAQGIVERHLLPEMNRAMERALASAKSAAR